MNCIQIYANDVEVGKTEKCIKIWANGTHIDDKTKECIRIWANDGREIDEISYSYINIIETMNYTFSAFGYSHTIDTIASIMNMNVPNHSVKGDISEWETNSGTKHYEYDIYYYNRAGDANSVAWFNIKIDTSIYIHEEIGVTYTSVSINVTFSPYGEYMGTTNYFNYSVDEHVSEEPYITGVEYIASDVGDNVVDSY